MAKLDDRGMDLMFHQARSYNAFKPVQVTTDDLREIWEVAKMGPTSTNQMPARILWCLSPESKDKLATMVGPPNVAKVKNAPVVAIIGMDLDFCEYLPKLFPHVDARPWFAGKPDVIEASAFRNSSLQGAYLIMAARALGFDAGPMSGFDNTAVDEAFFAGTSIKSNFICSLGHGDTSSIFGRLPRLDFDEANEVL